jgi:hypothetical protein
MRLVNVWGQGLDLAHHTTICPHEAGILSRLKLPDAVCCACIVQAVVPQVGDSTEQLHQRYVQALLALGKEHDVKLELV